MLQFVPNLLEEQEILLSLANNYSFLFFTRENPIFDLMYAKLALMFENKELIVEAQRAIEAFESFISAGYSFENFSPEEKTELNNFFTSLFFKVLQQSCLLEDVETVYSFRRLIEGLFGAFFKLFVKLDLEAFIKTCLGEINEINGNTALLEAFLNAFGLIFENYLSNSSFSEAVKLVSCQLIDKVNQQPNRFLEERLLNYLEKSIKAMINNDIEPIIEYILSQLGEDQGKNSLVLSILKIYSRYTKSIEIYSFISGKVNDKQSFLDNTAFMNIQITLLNFITSFRDYNMLSQTVFPVLEAVLTDNSTSQLTKCKLTKELILKFRIHKNSDFFHKMVFLAIDQITKTLLSSPQYTSIPDELFETVLEIMKLVPPGKSTFVDLYSLCCQQNTLSKANLTLMNWIIKLSVDISVFTSSLASLHDNLSKTRMSLYTAVSYTQLVSTMFERTKDDSLLEIVNSSVETQLGQLNQLTDYTTIKEILQNVTFLLTYSQNTQRETICSIVALVVESAVHFDETCLAIAAKLIEKIMIVDLEVAIMGVVNGMSGKFYKFRDSDKASIQKSLNKENLSFLVLKSILKDFKDIGNGDSSADCLLAYEIRK